MFTPIGCNQLHLTVNMLTFDFLDLCKKNLVEQNRPRCWNYMYGGSICTSKNKYGGNRP